MQYPHRLKKIILIGGFWLFSLTAILVYQTLQKPTFGTIDTHALVALEAKAMAKLYSKETLPPEVLQKIADKLKSHVEDFAREQRIILLAKGAVWGGELPDFTEIMIQRLHKDVKP